MGTAGVRALSHRLLPQAPSCATPQPTGLQCHLTTPGTLRKVSCTFRGFLHAVSRSFSIECCVPVVRLQQCRLKVTLRGQMANEG